MPILPALFVDEQTYSTAFIFKGVSYEKTFARCCLLCAYRFRLSGKGSRQGPASSRRLPAGSLLLHRIGALLQCCHAIARASCPSGGSELLRRRCELLRRGRRLLPVSKVPRLPGAQVSGSGRLAAPFALLVREGLDDRRDLIRLRRIIPIHGNHDFVRALIELKRFFVPLLVRKS